MCGITGIWGDGSYELIKGSVARLLHRGPDDSGLFHNSLEDLSLGHTRLSIIDLSPLGHQPMASADERFVIIYNGEIYNFPDLRAEMAARGYPFRSHSDTEVLLALYMFEGTEMLKKLNGIFAFAIWDRDEKSLFLARDHFGIKPLYYMDEDDLFAFASEMKALPLPQNAGIHSPGLHRYLTYLWCPGNGTPFKYVKKLGPGEAMVIRNRNISQHWQWYELPAFKNRVLKISQEDAIKGLQTTLQSAVERQMISDAPLGAFLSGGLDSSAIVAFAKDFNPYLECFTINPTGGEEEGRAEDLPYAQKVARHLKVRLNVIDVSPQQMADHLDFMVTHMDEPIADAAALNVYFISSLARQNGMKVLLSGSGGDDLFTGYPRHLALKLEKFWSWMPKGWRTALARKAGGLNKQIPLNRRLAKLFDGAELNGDVRLINYFKSIDEEILRDLYSKEFRAALKDAKATQPMEDFLTMMPDNVPRLERLLALEQRFFLTDHNLIYTDKLSMAASVEVRVPFLDPDVIEFAACLPSKYKLRGRTTKWVLKKAMEPYLPHEILDRPKTGFGAPLRHWMKHELRGYVNDILSIPALKRRGIFDPFKVQEFIHKNERGEVDGASTLLALLICELWCRRFIDQNDGLQMSQHSAMNTEQKAVRV